jgi:hypothetical protein
VTSLFTALSYAELVARALLEAFAVVEFSGVNHLA